MNLDQVKVYRGCPICKCLSSKNLFTGDRNSLGVQTSKCKKCGFIYTNPIEAKDFFDDFYQNHYRKYYKKNNSTPSEAYVELYKLRDRAREHVDWIHNAQIGDLDTVIDVGCAEGTLLLEMRDRLGGGLRCVGVEPDVQFAEYSESLGLEVYENIEKIPNIEGKVIVTMSHVLEHIYNIDVFFQTLKSKIKGDLFVYCSVPDTEEYSSIHDVHIAHIYHFNKNTMGRLFANLGFSMMCIEKHRPTMLPPSIRMIGCLKDGHNNLAALNYDRYGYAFFHGLKRQSQREIWEQNKVRYTANFKRIVKKFLSLFFLRGS